MITRGDRHDEGSTVSSGGCCGHTPGPEDPTTAHTDAVTECPVMICSPVIKASAEDAGLYRDYHGQRYWLCCASCALLFDADPERYVAA